jgi:hypothetical protein
MQKLQVVVKKCRKVPRTSDRAGPGRPRVGSGRAKSDTLALDPMRAGPDHKNSGPTLALLGSGRVGPALGQCK